LWTFAAAMSTDPSVKVHLGWSLPDFGRRLEVLLQK
jgi:hypothetical protein